MATVLKVLHCAVLYFFSLPFLRAVYLKLPLRKTIVQRPCISVLVSLFFTGLTGVGLIAVRLVTRHGNLAVTAPVVTAAAVLNIAISYLLPSLSLKEKSFLSALVESMRLFYKYPFITGLITLIDVGFKLTAVYSFFVLPTWLFGELFFSSFFLKVETNA